VIEDKREEDLAYVRETYIDLIEKAKNAIDFSFELARDSESPRAIEVFSNLIKSASDITDRLSDLHKTTVDKNKQLEKSTPGVPTNANQFNFYGTTTQIQEMMKQALDAESSIINQINQKEEKDDV
jgi:hypothetical protein